jgi:hypothetical protein
MYFYLTYPFIGFFVLIHITEYWFFCSSISAIGTTIQSGEFFKTSTDALQVKTIKFNQLFHRTQCDVFLWEILDVNIINVHPRPRQHHPCSSRLRGHPQDGRRKRSTDSTQASTFKFLFRPDNVVVQIIEPLAGAASCQGLRGEGSAS